MRAAALFYPLGDARKNLKSSEDGPFHSSDMSVSQGYLACTALRILLCCTPDGDPLPCQPTNILISFSTKNRRLQRPECMAAGGKILPGLGELPKYKTGYHF
jgi:hypothetical protein